MSLFARVARTPDARTLLRVRGQILGPGDAAYEERRGVYNAMFDARPGLIVRATDESDVAVTVRFARDYGVELAVRGGGHSIAGYSTCDGGIVLDLGALRGIAVDPERRTAVVGGGCTWGEVNEATHAHGLAAVGGLISSTGVAGLTLGGGIGYLTRRFGLACDNLRAVRLVTADGECRRCSEAEHPDLFWAVRGGGGNVGVVTAFEFALHPVASVVGGPIFLPLEGETVLTLGEALAAAPPELGAIVGLTLAPPVPVLPAERHGTPVAVVVACWSGAPNEADDALAPLADAGTVLGRRTGPLPYPVINTLFDDLLPRGLRHYWRSRFIGRISDTLAGHCTRLAMETPTVESGIFFYPVDGAASRVAPHDTAFPHRGARFAVGCHGSWHRADDDEAMLRWTRDAFDAAREAEDGDGAEYVNFVSEAGGGRGEVAYGANFERLRAIKSRWDPDNLFRRNVNVPPAPAA